MSGLVPFHFKNFQDCAFGASQVQQRLLRHADIRDMCSGLSEVIANCCTLKLQEPVDFVLEFLQQIANTEERRKRSLFTAISENENKH